MKRNARLSLALHALGHMNYRASAAQTSSQIAEHVDTNPVVVRRVLGKLRQAGLVTSERGRAGGWRLRLDPNEITLADVYVALDETIIASDPDAPPDRCSIEQALSAQVLKIMKEVEANFIERLSRTTIAEIQNSARH